MSARSRAAAFGLFLAATALAVAGCTPDGEVPPEQASASASSPPVTLRVAVYGPAKVLAAYRAIAADFHREHTRISVEVQTYADEADTLRAVRRDAAAGRTPDLFLTGVDALPGLQRDKLIQPVDALLGERQVDFGDGYPRLALESFSSDAALRCMPTQDSPLVVYYNPDLVDLDAAQGDDHPINATRGWTMAEFSRAVADVVADGHAGVYVDPTLDQVAPFAASAGGSVVDSVTDPKKTALGSSSAADGITQLLAALGPQKRAPKAARTPDSQDEALAKFEHGKLAMLLGYRDLTGMLRDSGTKVDFDVLPLPVIGSKSTSGDLAGMCLAQSAVDPGAAAEFLAYLVGRHPMAQLARTGYVMPTNMTVISSNAFWQPRKNPASASVFTTQLRYIDPRPVTELWPRVENLVDAHLTSIFAAARALPGKDRVQRQLSLLDEDTAAVLAPPSQTPQPSTQPSTQPSAGGSRSPSPGPTPAQ